MDIQLTTEPEDLIVSEAKTALVKRTVETVARLYDFPETEVSILLTNDEYICQLNREYRGIDRPTDVLSFALAESDEPAVRNLSGDEPRSLGDIIISLDKVCEQAAKYGHSEERELAFLTVHGMLHLLGYDHIEENERLEMENEQRIVMAELKLLR